MEMFPKRMEISILFSILRLIFVFHLNFPKFLLKKRMEFFSKRMEISILFSILRLIFVFIQNFRNFRPKKRMEIFSKRMEISILFSILRLIFVFHLKFPKFLLKKRMEIFSKRMEISILFSILPLIFVFSDKISEISAQQKEWTCSQKEWRSPFFLHFPAGKHPVGTTLACSFTSSRSLFIYNSFAHCVLTTPEATSKRILILSTSWCKLTYIYIYILTSSCTWLQIILTYSRQLSAVVTCNPPVLFESTAPEAYGWWHS